jgi:hypothetical protein
MDFDVQLDILVTRIGVFDSGSDGLALPITARLFDRDTLLELGVVDFTPEEPGDLVGGSRFKELVLDLPAGFHGTIVASGYGLGEPNGNGLPGPFTSDGGCSIQFTGGGRFGNDPIAFPGTADGGPHNRYAAGTFEYEPQETFPAQIGAIAYTVPAGTIGNQIDFGGAIGMDFNVNTPIVITRLGVFDSGEDGLGGPITARIFLRDTGGEIASLAFTPEDPGDLVESSRFKALVPPLELYPGFRGSMTAEGFGPLDPDGNLASPVPWTMDSGGCAISFTGSGRWGPVPGAYPNNIDAGPANRYAGGTFEFEIDETPPPQPPHPPRNLGAASGDARVELTWEAPGGTVAAATYRVFRADSIAGPFNQIAEVAGTSHLDLGLANEVTVCYLVRAVSAGGIASHDSAKVCAVPAAPLPAGRVIAYQVEAGVAGNQAFGGALGMDFDVIAPITVHRLGVFDDGSNGLTLPITARIFDRDTLLELASVSFTPAEPGILVGGSRFKPLEEPLELLDGFHGVMAASGYGAGELNGNQGVGAINGLSTDDGGCRIDFVGLGRFGNDPNAFPPTPDGGPANRYAAGTFDFEALGPAVDPAPQPPTGLSAALSGADVVLNWVPPAVRACVLEPTGYRVLRSRDFGPFEAIGDVPGTTFTDVAPAAGSDYCYVVRSLADGGAVSADSGAACATPGRHIAYLVPGGLAGTQIDGQPVGMDFDVTLDIEITRLGAFDSDGDGMQRPITIRVVDRTTELEVASVAFTPGDEGVLLGGSRFKALDAPLELSAGFQGSIVAEGYGDGEPNGAGAGPWTTNPGPCSLYFTGRGRLGLGAAQLPIANAVGRTDEYAAGTFEFVPQEAGVPRGAVAYLVPAGTFGNQNNFGGSLGLDFNVNVPITVTRLGVFDSGGDGLLRPIVARLYNRDTRESLAELNFTVDDPGDLEDGSRFKPLEPSLALPAGFHGTMMAGGYGAEEPNGNQGAIDLGLGIDDGGCAITFVGGGRFGALASAFPDVPDGGPANRYAAGTFAFEVEGEPPVLTFSRGDSNNDGRHNISDPVNTLNVLFLGTGVVPCQDAADSNDDGRVNISDPVNSLNVLFLGTGNVPPPFDPPGPRCGTDPTGDDLDCAAFTACP